MNSKIMRHLNSKESGFGVVDPTKKVMVKAGNIGHMAVNPTRKARTEFKKRWAKMTPKEKAQVRSELDAERQARIDIPPAV